MFESDTAELESRLLVDRREFQRLAGELIKVGRADGIVQLIFRLNWHGTRYRLSLRAAPRALIGCRLVAAKGPLGRRRFSHRISKQLVAQNVAQPPAEVKREQACALGHGTNSHRIEPTPP